MQPLLEADYADEVSFHMDALPCIPENPEVIRAICRLGVPRHLAETSVAITDRRDRRLQAAHPGLALLATRGASGTGSRSACVQSPGPRMVKLVEDRLYASIDQVPPYEWKTPAAARDPDPEAAPRRDVPGRSYLGTDLDDHHGPGRAGVSGRADHLRGVDGHQSTGCPNMWRHEAPDPKPGEPGRGFRRPLGVGPAIRKGLLDVVLCSPAPDIAKLPSLLRKDSLAADIRGLFRVDLTETQLRRLRLGVSVAVPAVVASRPALWIPTGPQTVGRP